MQTLAALKDQTNPYAALILKAQKDAVNPFQTLKILGGFPNCPLNISPSEMVGEYSNSKRPLAQDVILTLYNSCFSVPSILPQNPFLKHG